MSSPVIPKQSTNIFTPKYYTINPTIACGAMPSFQCHRFNAIVSMPDGQGNHPSSNSNTGSEPHYFQREKKTILFLHQTQDFFQTMGSFCKLGRSDDVVFLVRMARRGGGRRLFSHHSFHTNHRFWHTMENDSNKNQTTPPGGPTDGLLLGPEGKKAERPVPKNNSAHHRRIIGSKR